MTKMRKVLMLVENCPAPADHRIWPEAMVLRDSGYQVSIISPKGAADQRESYTCIDNIHIYRYHLPVIEQKYVGYVVEYGVALFLTFCLSVKVLFQRGFNEYSTMLKMMDYMALGKPVVAFDLTETRFTAQDAALYARPNLVGDFADKIEALLDDEGLRIKMGQIGRRRVQEELNWENTSKNLACAYEVLLPVGGNR
jgi:Glycosyl transferases group 1